MNQNMRSENRITSKNSVQNFSQKTSMSVLSNNHSLLSVAGDEVDFRGNDEHAPPAIPQKMRRKQDRQPSPYDNVPDANLGKVLQKDIKKKFQLWTTTGADNIIISEVNILTHFRTKKSKTYSWCLIYKQVHVKLSCSCSFEIISK